MQFQVLSPEPKIRSINSGWSKNKSAVGCVSISPYLLPSLWLCFSFSVLFHLRPLFAWNLSIFPFNASFFFLYPRLAVCVCWLNPFVREKVQNANRSFNNTFSPSTWNLPTKIKFLTLNVFGRTLPPQDTNEYTYLAWIILRRKHNIN